MHLLLHNRRRHRTSGAIFAVSFVVALLMTAFFAVQVRGGEAYDEIARGNRLRPILVPAPRGTIVDRTGEVIATSLTEYAVALAPAAEDEARRTLEWLSPFLGLTAAEVARLMDKRARRPDALLEVSDAATFAQAAALAERRASFPGVLVTERPVRHYPAGPAAAHLVGYTGEITRAELDRPEFAAYRQGQRVGRMGIEREYEGVLAGRDGARFVEVDARGRVLRAGAEAGRRAPVAGEPLALTVDLALQKYVHEIFPDSMRGALVAVEPSTGEVLALYSNPTFDPNALSGRIPPRLWSALQTDADKPLLNRAVTALYPPASTWKLATAAAALRLGLVREGMRMPLPCTGGMAYAGRYARCHERSGHGAVDLAGAIEKSCNVYFYQLGIQLGLAGLTEAGTRLGFGRRTGIDLPGEAKPRFPAGPGWYREAFGSPAVPSEVLSLSIGQGPNSQTVLRMAHFYSAIAGDGTARAPHLVRGTARPPAPELDLGLDEPGLHALWSGLARVSEPPGGTARASSLGRWKLFGKTGTAQNSQGGDHGWFVGFAGAPGGHAEVVVAVIVEHGLHGGDVAPLGAKAIDFYLSRRHGLPVDPRPTLLERWADGRKRWNTYDAHPNPPVPRPRRTLRIREAE